jgi:hypothetical protein
MLDPVYSQRSNWYPVQNGPYLLLRYKTDILTVKGTVSPEYKCLEVNSIKSLLLAHVNPDI